jgi:hypothetical protein
MGRISFCLKAKIRSDTRKICHIHLVVSEAERMDSDTNRKMEKNLAYRNNLSQCGWLFIFENFNKRWEINKLNKNKAIEGCISIYFISN